MFEPGKPLFGKPLRGMTEGELDALLDGVFPCEPAADAACGSVWECFAVVLALVPWWRDR